MTLRAAPATSLERRRSETQLRLKNRALAATAEGITIADARLPDNPLIYANAGFERLTGYSIGEVLGHNCRFLQGPGTDPATLNLLRAAIREQREITVQLLNYRKDGTTFWNRLCITPVRDSSGTVTHFIGVQSDVTAEKQAQDALARANEQLEAANRSIKCDLDAAAAIQRSLLPFALPESPGYRFAWRFRPCQELAGDFLNVLPLDGGHIGAYILDVSGHGVAAALLSVTLSHVLSLVPDRSVLYRPIAQRAGQFGVAAPAEVVAQLNREFRISPQTAQYFTMIYGVLDTGTGDFRYVAAGHPRPVRVRPGEAPQLLESGGTPVGLLAEASYEEQQVRLEAEERLYFFTDGLTDAERVTGEEFGAERLLEVLDRSRRVTLEESLDAAMACVEQWCAPARPKDDMALLAIECQL
jgi:PAS domain S-box-containing protein